MSQAGQAPMYATNSLTGSPSSPGGGPGTEMSSRKVSSIVVESELMGAAPQDTVRYVDVPTYEEQIKYVTVKEVREVEKMVPVIQVEYRDRVVEVPQIEYVDRVVETPVYIDQVREVRVPRIVERPVEVVREVHVTKPRVTEQTVEVPGETFYVDKPFTREQVVEVMRYNDVDVPVIVQQSARPIIMEGSHRREVEVTDYSPQVIPVDVHIAHPVESTIEAVGTVSSKHRLTNITAAQYNTILRSLNVGVTSDLPFVAENGNVAFANEDQAKYILLDAGITIEGYTRPALAPTTTTTTTHSTQSYLANNHTTAAMQSTNQAVRGPGGYPPFAPGASASGAVLLPRGGGVGGANLTTTSTTVVVGSPPNPVATGYTELDRSQHLGVSTTQYQGGAVSQMTGYTPNPDRLSAHVTHTSRTPPASSAMPSTVGTADARFRAGPCCNSPTGDSRRSGGNQGPSTSTHTTHTTHHKTHASHASHIAPSNQPVKSYSPAQSSRATGRPGVRICC